MKKIAIRIGVLLTVFIVTVAATTLFMNSENTDNTGDLNTATLPEVLVDINGTLANRMFGYKQEMQVDFNRDSLTPVDTTREINLAIAPHEEKINGLSYEVRTSDGSRVVENQSIRGMVTRDNYLRASIKLTSDNMLMNQEYSLQIELDTEQGPIYYYTRVIQRSGLNTDKYVDFVQGFYQKCLNKDTSAELADYIEPDSSVSNSSFTDVSIKSSLDMITWGKLNPQISRKGVPIIKDINETTGSITLKYQISAKDDEGNQELYEVSDFYRMRYTQARVMLLDFRRSTQQVFDGTLTVADSDGLNLGVVSRDVQYVSNPSADIVAFVQNGDLWSYSHSASKATRIFSFRSEDSADERDDNNEHNMKVLRVDESGDMDFVLYGYMNRGPHEGYVGTAVYHYSSSQNVVEEQVFIPSTLSYEFLHRDLERLSYVNEQNQMFLLTEGNLYKIDIAGKSFEILQDKIDLECFATSGTNARAAWMNEMEPDSSTSITEIDFETARTRSISVEQGQYVKILGFMNEDLIYGITREENVVTDTGGKKIFAMDEIKIEDFDGTVKKDYSREGMYITDVKITETLMEVQLSDWQKKAYVYRSSENIMNNKKAVEDTVTQNLVYTERRGYVVRLDFKQKVSNPQPVVLVSKMRAMEHANILDMSIEPSENEVYYVYAYGKLDNIYSDPAEAIMQADEKTGVVLNRAQQYVWERGNKKTKIQLNQGDIPPEVLKGTLDAEKLQEELGDSATVMNLTGCTLDSVLYEVSSQRPVIAAQKKGKSLVIVGYDEYNTLVYDPKTGETKYMGMNDSTEAFQKAGNIFITYIENLK